MSADATVYGSARAAQADRAPVPVVELRDVFRVHRTSQGDAAALQGTTLNVGRGEQLCVLGPSGAGKSTLLRVIAGLEPPSAGLVGVLGRDMGRVSARERAVLRRRAIGFLDQRSGQNLCPDLAVSRGIVLALALRGAGRGVRRTRAAELLEAVSLRDRAAALPAELSGGERQRLALCAALAHRPALLLADEPTGELDEASAAAVRTLIGELSRACGTTVVVVSHDPAMAAVADRTVSLRDGRVGDERREGAHTLVVNRGGWVRLPAGLLAQAGIANRATAHAGDVGLTLRPADVLPAAEAGENLPRAQPSLAPAQHTTVTLECRSIAMAYGRGTTRRQVISGLSASFVPGTLTVVTGRSGAGKSTLLRLLAGIEQPDHGEVVLDGRSLGPLDVEARAGVRRSVVGFLGQEDPLVPFLSAHENVELALAMRADADPARAQRLVATFARLGLADRAHQRVSRLSAGERQRVALARALVCARGLVLVDEPTSRLDEAAAVVAAEALAAAAREGHTVICATHEPVVIARADHELAL